MHTACANIGIVGIGVQCLIYTLNVLQKLHSNITVNNISKWCS